MRVPVPIVVLLCLAVVAGTWWFWTRDCDFLTPPTEIHAVDSTNPSPVSNVESQESTPSAPVETPPELAEYHALAMGNPDDLPGLATKLEEDGKIQRALLAHERIIDSTRATPQRLASSVQDVRRLRALLPPWNPDPEKSLPLTLHAGTAGQNADRIAPIIEKFAAEISAASAGIVRMQATVHRGNDPVVGSLPPPVAIWLSGGDDANATPVLSFTLAEDEDPQAVIFETLLKILRGEAARDASPQHIPAFDSPHFDHITRLVWEKIGLRLNPPKS